MVFFLYMSLYHITVLKIEFQEQLKEDIIIESLLIRVH